MLGSFLKRMIGTLSGTRGFEGASNGRRWDQSKNFGPLGPEVLAATAPVRGRARDAIGNNPWAKNGCENFKTALVGAGIVPSSSHPDENTREALNSEFTRWVPKADADGLTDFHGLVASAVLGMIVDGESFIHLIYTLGGLRLRLVPPEMVDAAHTVELGNGARIIAGIEFDAEGNRVAYWVLQGRPTDLFATYAPPIRIPAHDMLHLFAPLGAGQVRGISWLAPCLLRLSELDALEDALLVGAKVAAMHAGFLKDMNGTGTAFEGNAVGGILETGLEPGTLKVLPSGYDISFSTPQQAQQAVDFAKLQLRAVAAGLGVPEHLLTGDLSQANYSSLRGGLVPFKQRVEQIQFQTIIPQVLNPIWQRVIGFSIVAGRIDIGDSTVDPDIIMGADWYPPAMPWVDPLKDADATVAMLGAGLMSRRQAVATLGWNVEALDREIAADRAREKRLGLAFNTAAPVRKEPTNAV